MIEHHRLDRADAPCEMSPGYNFGDCVLERLSEEIGCQFSWTEIPDIPPCSGKDIRKYIHLYQAFSFMEKRRLQERTGCLDPCSYTQYKATVTTSRLHNSKLSLFRLSL